MDQANRWCWQRFGPSHGECDQYGSEYPGCPLVLATGAWKTEKGDRNRWVYQAVEAHSHRGSWCGHWFEKTAYNFGFHEWYFANASDRERFVECIPTINWGENYPK